MYPLGELSLLPMSSSAQNNRIAESRRRFGAARPLVHSPTSPDTSRQALESYLITGWIVPPFHVRTEFARPFLYQRPQVATSDQNDHRNSLQVLTHAVQARLLPAYQRIGIALQLLQFVVNLWTEEIWSRLRLTSDLHGVMKLLLLVKSAACWISPSMS